MYSQRGVKLHAHYMLMSTQFSCSYQTCPTNVLNVCLNFLLESTDKCIAIKPILATLCYKSQNRLYTWQKHNSSGGLWVNNKIHRLPQETYSEFFVHIGVLFFAWPLTFHDVLKHTHPSGFMYSDIHCIVTMHTYVCIINLTAYKENLGSCTKVTAKTLSGWCWMVA